MDQNENYENENNDQTAPREDGGQLDYSSKQSEDSAGYKRTEANVPSDFYNSGASGIYTTSDGASGYIGGVSENNRPKVNRHGKRSPAFIVALLLAVAVVAGTFGFMGAYVAESFAKGETPADNTSMQTEDTADDDGIIPAPNAKPAGSNGIAKQTTPDVEETSECDDTVTLPTGKLTIAQTVKKVADTVVVIVTEKSTWYGQYVQSGAGSGVIIRDDGIIVTNFHVIDSAQNIVVTTTDGTNYQAKVVGYDETSDIAILSIDPQGKKLKAAELGSSDGMLVGDEVIAIGNPLGTLGGTVTNGIISAKERQISIDGNVMTLLQTNAEVSPGNSGGGLFDLYGKLIGIVNAKSSDTSAEGLGFAIPVDYAYSIITQLLDYGYVKGIVDTGLTVRYLNEINAMFNNLINAGLYIVSSEYSDELKNADRIISINGYSVNSESDYKSIIRAYNVGDTVTIRIGRVERNGRELREKEYEFELVLHEYVPEIITAE